MKAGEKIRTRSFSKRRLQYIRLFLRSYPLHWRKDMGEQVIEENEGNSKMPISAKSASIHDFLVPMTIYTCFD